MSKDDRELIERLRRLGTRNSADGSGIPICDEAATRLEALQAQPVGEDGGLLPAQFFFEIGYGACWTEAFVRNKGAEPFPLKADAIARTWELAGETYDDPEEFDRYLALANAAALTASPPVVEREALENAAKNLLAGMSGTYKSRNGREMGIEADDGEKCWIVHSDLIAALEGALADASVVEEGRREAVKDARERVCKLTMQDGAVIEAEYPNGGDWAKSWSIRYPPDMKCGTTGEQDWELVEKYGLTEILDAVILALTPVEGVGERLRPFVQHKVNCRMQLRMGNRECSCGLTDALAALSTPVAQGDEVREGIYVASRASIPERGQMWRDLRAVGVQINSSWIDEDGEGETADWSELWTRIEGEVKRSKALVLYAEPSDFPLKGAFVEAGMALAAGIPVLIVAPGVELGSYGCRPIGSWASHPLVTYAETIGGALATLTKGARDAG